MRKFLLPSVALLLMLSLLLCGCPKSSDESHDDDDSGVLIGPGSGDQTVTECETFFDCPDELICKSGWCVEPRYPELNDEALRRPTADDPDENVLVNGRLLRPAQRTTQLGTFPTNLEISPDGSLLAVNENGYGTVLDPEHWRTKKHVLRIVDPQSMEVVQELVMPNGSMYIGLRFNAAGSRLYVSGGEDQAVHVYAVESGELSLERSIPVDGCYTTDLRLSPDQATLYVSCELTNDVAAIDLSDDQTIGRWDAGWHPYELLLSADGGKLFVSNWAGFQLPEEEEKDGDKLYPRKPNTVTVINTANGEILLSIPVGLSPEGLTLSPEGSTVYVVCNKSDSVYAIDVASLAVTRIYSLHADFEAPKGISPINAAISPDGSTLYINGAGDNLVALLDLQSGEVRGSIPTEWYPTDLALSADGSTLYVLNGKGRGDGPTEYEGQGQTSSDRDQVGRQIFGSIFKLAVPDEQQLADYTQTVYENNYRQLHYFNFENGNDSALPSPDRAGESPIKHVFLILKENFSYDCAYGDMEIGEGKPEYNMWTEEMLPNQRKLAREYTLFDNFYCDSESSIDGHQWAAAAIEPDYVEKGWVLDYAGYGMPGIVVSVTPGSIPESNFFMPHLIEQGIDVYGYGGVENFGIEAATRYRDYYMFKYPFNLVREDLDRDRAWMFVHEFNQRVLDETVPQFSWIFLPNNHAFGVHPGQWTPASWVADNDEAVGIVVEAIAHSPIWYDSLIVIFEDDAQHGFDHIDKHRSPALAVGPWVKRGYVSSVAYSMPNMHKTIELVLGSTPMNRFDQLCTGMYDVFRAKPDYERYVRVERIYPEEIYEGSADDPLVQLSQTMDWDGIDENQWYAAELYWRLMKGTDPPTPNSEPSIEKLPISSP
ncbi:MAG: bifunctional YncE family protein/alkaline phosphatase family protein [Candidatus Alcyoniella australis]|nr:bifunctional YncE family protein/alkaline phosphatase family protein [Candidatus Alcyoniella australis]